MKTYWHRLNNDPNAQEKSQVVALGVNEHAVRQAKKMYRSRNRTAWVCMKLKSKSGNLPHLHLYVLKKVFTRKKIMNVYTTGRGH